MKEQFTNSVLLVDDDTYLLSTVAAVLRGYGCVVHSFSNCDDALNGMSNENVGADIVLTDIRMPGISGLDLLEKMNRLYPELPVILMTGQADLETTVLALRQHAFDLILKPIDFSRFIRTVKKALNYAELLKSRKDYELVLEKIVLEKTEELHDKVAELEKANETVNRSRDYYLRLFQNFPSLIWRAGTDSKCNYFNQTWLDFTGRTLEQELGDGWAVGVHQEDQERCLAIYREAFKNRRPFVMDYRLQHNSGNHRWISDHGSPYFDLDGNFAGYIGSCYDIDEQKQAQETERRMRQEHGLLISRLKLVLESMPVGCIVNDSNYVMTYWNKAAEKIFGFSRDETLGKTPWELFVPISALIDIKSLRQHMISRNMPLDGLQENLTKDGREIFCDWHHTPMMDEDGAITGFISMVQDVTERMTVEQALRDSEERFRQLFEQNDDAIVLFDYQDLLVLDSNMAAEKLFGFQRDELILRENPPFLDLEVHQRFVAELTGLDVDGVLNMDRLKIIRKDGSRMFTSVRGKLMTLLNRKVLYCSFRDITEKIRLEEEARAAQAKLIQADKMSSLGLLVSGMAHEINNPNNFILFNSSLLAEAWNSAMPVLSDYYRENGDFALGSLRFSDASEVVPRLFSGMVKGAERINTIVNKLKDFARQDNGRTCEPVNINEVILDAISMLNHEIKKYCEGFQLVAANDLPPALCNGQQIEQVLINLIMNSLQALPDRNSGIRITSSLSEDTHRIAVTVADEGCGMAPEVLTMITEPFFTTKGETGGTGLGLSISASILRENQAELRLSSEPGKGTTATILLQIFENQ